ncbi:MAG TPA: helix-turn-helix domain-containing protein [Firmicutes bacterium]|nr:helix-turn-helix domain-containing protein [Bacillota bacterium]
MTGLGTLLQEARLEQGLTIEDMVERTKIRADFLQAMEAGDFEKLPDRAYVRPFLRTYARALGLAEDQVALEFDVRCAPAPDELLSLRERRQHLQKKKRSLFVLRFATAVIVVAAVGYILLRFIYN